MVSDVGANVRWSEVPQDRLSVHPTINFSKSAIEVDEMKIPAISEKRSRAPRCADPHVLANRPGP
jgi:hypothetical protein